MSSKDVEKNVLQDTKKGFKKINLYAYRVKNHINFMIKMIQISKLHAISILKMQKIDT